MKYIALIGDLISSKEDPNRKTTQETLNASFEVLNDEFEEIIVSKFTITLGDEFQVLLKPDLKVLLLLDKLTSMLHQHPFRIGIGYGEVLTSINMALSIGADGPAYWYARDCVDMLKSSYHNGKQQRLFKSEGSYDKYVNTLFLLTDILRSNWTNTQVETFHFLLDQGIYTSDFNQKIIAKDMQISQSSLSKRLNNGNIKEYLFAMENLGSLLEEVWSPHEPE